MRRPLDWAGDANAILWTKPQDVRLEYLPYRYPTRSAVTLEAEIRQIESCMKKRYPRLKIGRLTDDTLSVVGYGPTLHDTWKDIKHPCITVSGALDFLQDRGIIPDYHAECDGRDYKTRHLEHANKETKYLMASICNPRMWHLLEGCHVEYWHNANGQHVVDWIGKNDLGSILIAGGSNIGLTAIHIGGILGYRKFRLFGFDSNFVGTSRHAGVHYASPQRTIKRIANGHVWDTTPQMSNAADELLRLYDDPNVEIEIAGDSMQKDLFIDSDRSRDWWNSLWSAFDESMLVDIRQITKKAEARRALASFNTGSINEVTAIVLKLITERLQPATVVEVGTFIGTSSGSMKAGHIYTCDRDNNCLPSTEGITCHPWTSSTDMLGKLVEKGIKADFMYFDGRLQMADIPLIMRLSKQNTTYAVDDYIGMEKGVKNVERLYPYLPAHNLITPCGIMRDLTTTAFMVPK